MLLRVFISAKHRRSLFTLPKYSNRGSWRLRITFHETKVLNTLKSVLAGSACRGTQNTSKW